MNYKELIPDGTKVRIIKPINSLDESKWTVVPIDSTKKDLSLPENYELVDGWGYVTLPTEDDKAKISKRLEKYKQPVFVQEYIICEFDEELWNAYQEAPVKEEA